MKPQYLTREQLSQVLFDMARKVYSGDSFQGNIEYDFTDPDSSSLDQAGVIAYFRTGNIMGQGGAVVIGEISK